VYVTAFWPDGILHIIDDVETARHMGRTHPVTFVVCDQDRSIVPADQERVAGKVRRVSAAHMAPLSASRGVAAAIHGAALM
jgi:hypothetical protein